MRYIDADLLKDEYYGLFHHGTMTVKSALPIFVDLLDKQPTADVAEVKHGEWIGEYEETCSECGRSISEILDDGSYYSTEFNIKEFIACPYCGAKMG